MTNEILEFIDWFQKQTFTADQLEKMFLDKYEEIHGEDLRKSLRRHNEACGTDLHFIPYLYETNRLEWAYDVFHALMKGE